MADRQVTLKFEQELYDCFKAACIRHQTSPQRELAACICRTMRAWHEPLAYPAMPSRAPEEAPCPVRS